MDIRKENTTVQIFVLICICLFGCGAYFVYDAPASLMSYFMAGLGLNNSQYMDYYTWYSAPGIVMCVLGGVLIDNFLGRRLGGIVFCACIFFGQLAFAWSVENQWHYTGLLGRTLIGTGVESVAVASNCYLAWWFKGTPLQALAFGSALSIWRMSSSVSLMTMLPLYKSSNEVTPRDGITNDFSYAKGSDINVTLGYEVFGGYELADETRYYCYNMEVMHGCQIKSTDQIDSWHADDKPSACAEFDTITRQFIENAGIIKHGCWNPETFTADQAVCESLDYKWQPTGENEWAFFDEHYKQNKDKLSVEFQSSARINELRNPFYWSAAFGEYLEGEALARKQKLWRELNYARTTTETFTMATPRYEYNTTMEDQVWTPVTFYEKMSNSYLYSGSADCSSADSVLVTIPEEDTTSRLKSVAYCYYIMLVVTVLSVVMGVILYKVDGAAEANYNKSLLAKGESLPPAAEPFSVMGFIGVVKDIPVTVFILYIMCICFYVSVFIFVSQAPNFFSEYGGVDATTAARAVGMVYLVAVPCNPIVGALVGVVQNQVVFLTGAFLLAGFSHLLMTMYSGSLIAFTSTSLLAVSYSFIGCTMWPLVGNLVPGEILGKVYGLMFATQQAGLAIAAKIVGAIQDSMGWAALESFYIVLCIVGFCLGVILIGKLGRNMPPPCDQPAEKANQEEMQELKQEEC